MRVERQLTIRAEKKRVWAVLADFGGAHKWAPGVKQSTIIGDVARGAGCQRSCSVASLGTIRERATIWNHCDELEVSIDGLPLIRDVRSSWRLRTGENASETLVRARMTYATSGGPLGALLGATVIWLMMSRELRRSLDGLRRYTENAPVVASVAA